MLCCAVLCRVAVGTKGRVGVYVRVQHRTPWKALVFVGFFRVFCFALRRVFFVFLRVFCVFLFVPGSR